MGLDVGAYTKWEKVKVEYQKPILKNNLNLSGEKLNQLRIDFFKRTNEEFDDYIFDYVGYNKDSDFYPHNLEKYVAYGQELKNLLYAYFTEKELHKLKPLINALKAHSALLRIYENKEFRLYSFDKLEKYEREIWDYDDYVDVLYPNSEILDAFKKVKEIFNIDLFPYIINTECVEYIKDESVNHNISDGICLVKQAIERDTNTMILYNRTPKPLYLKDVLKECIRLWELGAKLEYC